MTTQTVTTRGKESTRLALLAKAALERQNWQPGDRLTNESRDAIGALWLAVKSVAALKVHSLSRHQWDADADDLLQQMSEMLPYAAIKYDPSRGRAFNTFAGIVFWSKGLRMRVRNRKAILDSATDGMLRNLIDRRSHRPYDYDDPRRDEWERLDRAIRRLKPRMRRIMVERHAIGKPGCDPATIPQIAYQHKVSRTRAGQLAVMAETEVKQALGLIPKPVGRAAMGTADQRDAIFLNQAALMPGASATKIGESLGFSMGVVDKIVLRTGYRSRFSACGAHRLKRAKQQVA